MKKLPERVVVPYSREDFVNITREVEQAVSESEVKEGLVLVNAMHITASSSSP